MATKAPSKRKQDIKLRIKAHDHRLIDESVKMVIEAARGTGSTVVGPIPLKNKVFKLTILRSPTRHTDAREQYKLCMHKRVLFIAFANPNTIDALKDLTLPDGVEIDLQQM